VIERVLFYLTFALGIGSLGLLVYVSALMIR
jgi:hypothetical protein